ncbi:hypothetical protein FBULB1_2165 [Fusarium bulbicola]|nr:hypothetical protein FBULB1_2165 [Fusarium bulbicola]
MSKLSAGEYELRALSSQIQNTLYNMDPSSRLATILQETMVTIRRHQESRASRSSEGPMCEGAEDDSLIATLSSTDTDSDRASLSLASASSDEPEGEEVTADATSSALGTDSDPAPTAQESAAINEYPTPTETRVEAWLDETTSTSSDTSSEKTKRKKRKFDDDNSDDDDDNRFTDRGRESSLWYTTHLLLFRLGGKSKLYLRARVYCTVEHPLAVATRAMVLQAPQGDAKRYIHRTE